MEEEAQVTLRKGYRPRPKDILSGRSRKSYNHGRLFGWRINVHVQRPTMILIYTLILAASLLYLCNRWQPPVPRHHRMVFASLFIPSDAQGAACPYGIHFARDCVGWRPFLGAERQALGDTHHVAGAQKSRPCATRRGSARVVTGLKETGRRRQG